MISTAVIMSALELGCVYALVALALFLSFRILNIADMTVAEIAEATGKSERGVKSMLSRRGISAKDHDGVAKRAKLDAKSAK